MLRSRRTLILGAAALLLLTFSAILLLLGDAGEAHRVVWVRANSTLPLRDVRVRTAPDGTLQRLGGRMATCEPGGVLALWRGAQLTHLATGEQHRDSQGVVWYEFVDAAGWHRGLQVDLEKAILEDSPQVAPAAVVDAVFDRRRLSPGTYPTRIWVHDDSGVAVASPLGARFFICGGRGALLSAEVSDRIVVISRTFPVTGPTGTFVRTGMPGSNGWAPHARMRPIAAYLAMGSWISLKDSKDPVTAALSRLVKATTEDE